jgi:hypothetical protein
MECCFVEGRFFDFCVSDDNINKMAIGLDDLRYFFAFITCASLSPPISGRSVIEGG